MVSLTSFFSSRSGLESVEWSSSEVSALFAKETRGPGEEEGEDERGGNGDGTDGEPLPSSTPVGAIIGGVVGGVGGIALVAGIAWFVLRRRRAGSTAVELEGLAGGIYQTHEQRFKSPPHYPPSELQSNDPLEFHAELENTERATSPGNRQLSESDSSWDQHRP